MKKDYLNRKKAMNSELKKAIIIILIVLLMLIILYFLTTVILNKDNDGSDRITENTIQYNEILAGESFNKSEEEYYVIYFDSTNEYSTISSLISSYQLNNSGTKLYSVDIANAINSKYLTDGDIITDDASSLRIKENTLIKFSNGKASEVITDITEITNILNS